MAYPSYPHAYPPAPPTVPVPVPVPVATPASPTHAVPTPSASSVASVASEFKWSDVEVDWSRPDIYRLGIGGNGEVWAGKYQRHMDVAIKISKEVTPDFAREVNILKSIRHPNVVQYIGAAESHGRWFLVTELCRYKSLQELLGAPTMRPQLTWLVRKRMLKDAALGLYHLHSKKIVHMDVKPLNFFVTEHFSVKIGDFGLSKQIIHTKIGASVKGRTVTHAAPETLEGKCSFPADVYSFALVMYELLTLTPPWTTAQIGPMPDLLPNRVHSGLRPILPQSMPMDHQRLIEWSWHGDVSKRATMNDILTRIDSLSNPEPITPPSPSPATVVAAGPSPNELRLISELATMTRRYNESQAANARLTSQVESLKSQLNAALGRVETLESYYNNNNPYTNNPYGNPYTTGNPYTNNPYTTTGSLSSITTTTSDSSSSSSSIRGPVSPSPSPQPDTITRMHETEAARRQASDQKLVEEKRSADLIARLKRRYQLCVIIDVTSSMAPYMDIIRDKCMAIAEYIATDVPHVTVVEVAIVGYRDYGDRKQHLVFPFTSDMSEVRKSLAALVASEDTPIHERDVPEDLVGGLLQARGLSWSKSSSSSSPSYSRRNRDIKQVLIITDAPCHGRQYHNTKDGEHIKDNYPFGDPSGITPESLLLEFKRNHINVTFGRLTAATDRMIEVFKQSYDPGEPRTPLLVQDMDCPPYAFSVYVVDEINPYRLALEAAEEEEEERQRQRELQADSDQKLAEQQRAVDAPKRRYQLCFIIDVTSSMAPYIDTVRTKCGDIMEYIQTEYPGCTVEVAVVTYRDYGDKQQHQVLPFTLDRSVVRKFLATLVASEDTPIHERDVPEDLVGGLLKASDLAWSKPLPNTRSSYQDIHQMVLITDAPCHGREYYDEKLITRDNYPNGDPSGLRPEHFLLDFKRGHSNPQVTFGRLTPATDRMVEVWKEMYEPVEPRTPLLVQAITTAPASAFSAYVWD